MDGLLQCMAYASDRTFGTLERASDDFGQSVSLDKTKNKCMVLIIADAIERLD